MQPVLFVDVGINDCRSPSSQFAVAILELLAATAGAWVVAAHTHASWQLKTVGLVTIGAGVLHTLLGAFRMLFNILCHLLQLLRLLDAHGQQHAGHFVLDLVDQLAEQLKRLALVFLLGLLLCKAAQVDTLAQIVQRC